MDSIGQFHLLACLLSSEAGNMSRIPDTAVRRYLLENTSPEERKISKEQGFFILRPKRLPEGDVLHPRQVKNVT